MKICYVNAYFDNLEESPREFLDRVYTVREFAREQAKLGHEVHVLQLFHRDCRMVQDRVTYWFIRAPLLSRLTGTVLRSVRRSTPAAHFEPATSLVRRLESIHPDVVHFFGMILDVNLRLVANGANALGIPIVAQYNGGSPPRNRIRRALHRGNLRRVDRFLFTTHQHATPWLDQRMPLDPDRVVPEFETSSVFMRRAKVDARRTTGMIGDPVVLWTGRLHPEKDPVTALRGFEMIAGTWPDTRLYLYYLTDELALELRQTVDASPVLKDRVVFRGTVPHAEMEPIFNSADFFLQASTREAGGNSVMEAMSCGVIPIVTEIPSFRAMTNGGRFGRLFSIGDPDALARAALSIDRTSVPDVSEAIYEHFTTHLSFPAIAGRLDHLYRCLGCEHRGPGDRQ